MKITVKGSKLIEKLQAQRDRAGATIKSRCGYPHALAIPAQVESAAMPLPAGARIVAARQIEFFSPIVGGTTAPGRKFICAGCR